MVRPVHPAKPCAPGGAARRRRRALGLRAASAWFCAGAVATSYFASLAVVRALEADDDADCSATCALAAANDTGNVLVVGDSIMEGYFPALEGLLGDRGGTAACEAAEGVAERGVLAEAVKARFGAGTGYCGTSFGVLQCADPYLASLPGNLSVIHFNWGLHDICEDIYHVKLSFDEYEQNLEELYFKLKGALSANGTMIFATTTPVPPDYRHRTNSDVLELNARAKALFGPTGRHPDVQIDDLYEKAVAVCREDPATTCYPETCDCPLIQDDGVHFSPAGYRYSAIMAAAAVAPYLPGLLDEGVRAPTQEGDTDRRLPRWQVALIAQAIVLGAIAVVATLVLYLKHLLRPPAAEPLSLVSPRTPPRGSALPPAGEEAKEDVPPGASPLV